MPRSLIHVLRVRACHFLFVSRQLSLSNVEVAAYTAARLKFYTRFIADPAIGFSASHGRCGPEGGSMPRSPLGKFISHCLTQSICWRSLASSLVPCCLWIDLFVVCDCLAGVRTDAQRLELLSYFNVHMGRSAPAAGDAQAQADVSKNPEGPKFDLGRAGAFTRYAVLIAVLVTADMFEEQDQAEFRQLVAALDQQYEASTRARTLTMLG